MTINKEELAAHLFNLLYDQTRTFRTTDDFTDVTIDGQIDLEEISAAILDFLG